MDHKTTYDLYDLRLRSHLQGDASGLYPSLRGDTLASQFFPEIQNACFHMVHNASFTCLDMCLCKKVKPEVSNSASQSPFGKGTCITSSQGAQKIVALI